MKNVVILLVFGACTIAGAYGAGRARRPVMSHAPRALPADYWRQFHEAHRPVLPVQERLDFVPTVLFSGNLDEHNYHVAWTAATLELSIVRDGLLLDDVKVAWNDDPRPTFTAGVVGGEPEVQGFLDVGDAGEVVVQIETAEGTWRVKSAQNAADREVLASKCVCNTNPPAGCTPTRCDLALNCMGPGTCV